MYPFNYPFAKFISAIGIPVYIKIEAFLDEEAGVYVASSPNVKGLHVEAESLDELRKEIELTLPGLLEINETCKKNYIPKHHAHLNICTPIHA